MDDKELDHYICQKCGGDMERVPQVYMPPYYECNVCGNRQD